MKEEERDKLLEVQKLEVTYHKAVIAIQGVNFSVPRGSVVGLFGVNGAGKTTTLRAISGFLPGEDIDITDGVIIFEGQKINGKSPPEVASLGIALVPERKKIFVTLTVEENLLTIPSSFGNLGESLDMVYDLFPVLKERCGQVAGYLSGGERQMLAIALGLMSRPKVLMIDELSLGLAPKVTDRIATAIKRVNKEFGITMLLVEQNVSFGLQIAEYGYIMENGRIVYEGPSEELMNHEDVREFYLGLVGEEAKSYRDVKQYRRVRRWWG